MRERDLQDFTELGETRLIVEGLLGYQGQQTFQALFRVQVFVRDKTMVLPSIKLKLDGSHRRFMYHCIEF